MRIDPQHLIRRLTPTAHRLLEAAVGRAVSGQFYEITVEHLLQAILESPDSDASKMIKQYGQDPAKLGDRVQRALEKQRSGNPGRPTLSENLTQWFEEAWLLGSLIFGHVKLHTAVLVIQLSERPGRYTAENFPELEALDTNEIRKEFGDIMSSSAEQMEALPSAGGGDAGAAPRSGGEALKRFTTNFTEKARNKEIDPIFGRHREIRQVVDILARRRKNNPIIVGEPGVGKTALAEGLALAIVEGDVPDSLKNIELLELDLGLLQAGAGVKGEFENRLKAVISEVKASTKPIVLFIDEAHTLIGSGASAGGGDAANLLKPALARGELRTVAATTWAEYKKYFEKDAALERRFQPVKVDQPSIEDAVVMLRGLREVYERAHGVTITDEGVVAAVNLSHRYISGRQLPDKAVDLLDTAATRVNLGKNAKPEHMVQLQMDLAAYNRAKDALERDRGVGHAIDEDVLQSTEQKIAQCTEELAALQARWEAERAAAQTLSEARGKLLTPEDGADLDALRAASQEAHGKLMGLRGEEALVPTEVDEGVVAQVVASWTGIPVGKMKSDAISAVLELEERLMQRVIGQDHAMNTVAEAIRISSAGIRNPNAPVGVLLFVGPSGVGKTETAISLAEQLFGGERFLTSINMSEFQEKHTVSRLIGSPPGYVGYGEGGVLTEAVRQRPYSVVLLDEVEKADLEVMNLFYQVFDKGMLSDGEGREIDFKNTIIILTSNLATDEIMKIHEDAEDEPPAADDVVDKIRPILSKHFKPALLARMTIIPYAPISQTAMRKIAEIKLGQLKKRLEASHKMEATFAPELVDELIRSGMAAEVGARNVEHKLRASLMPVLSRALLERLAEGDPPRSVELGLSPSGEWRIDFDV